MKHKTLLLRKAAHSVLMVLLLVVAGLSPAFAQSEVPEGALVGKFTVSEGHQVYFSQGNLQYQASTNTWRFAESQWDFVGGANADASESYEGWIDFFGWGTSGYNHGAECYQPWSLSGNYPAYYIYGSSDFDLYDQTGQADWGYNAIENGGNSENSGWRTLTHDEWGYVFNVRSTTSGIRYAKAKVNDVNGVALLPDDWNESYFTLSNSNTYNASYSSNVISADQWTTLEQHGAVFFPAAGYRIWNYSYENGSSGLYWSATRVNYIDTWMAYFTDDNLSTDYVFDDNYGRGRAKSVRLVRNLPFVSASVNPATGGTVEGVGSFSDGELCTLTAVPNDGYSFVCWTNEDGSVVDWGNTFTFYVYEDVNLVANFIEVTIPLYETFEDYNVGNQIAMEALAAGNNRWTTWNYMPGSGEDGFVAQMDGDKCGHIVWNNDQIYLLGNVESGSYTISFDMYIPEGHDAYNNLLHRFGSQNVSQWCTEVYFKHYQRGTSIQAGGMTTYFDCPYDAWFNVKYLLNLDTDIASFYVDEVEIATWQFSRLASGSFGTKQMAALDFYGPDDASEFYFDNISVVEEVPSFSVSVVSSPTEGGIVSGDGVFEYGAECTLTATANENYSFMYWTLNGEVVSNEPTYTFPVPRDGQYEAVFTLPLTINATAYLAEGGTLQGTGEYDYGAECTLSVTPNEGYVFVCWTENGEVVSWYDPYVFTVEGPRNLVANFVPTTVSLNETFEEYTVGNHLAAEALAAGNNKWTTWSFRPGSEEDGFIAQMDGGNCGQIVGGNDQVLLFGNIGSGDYTVSFDMFIPEGHDAYNNMLHVFLGPEASQWCTEVYYNHYQKGTSIQAGGSTVHFDCPYDTWFNVKYVLSIDRDIVTFYVDDVEIHSWQFSLLSGGATGIPQLAAIDFYGPDSNSEFYIDNISLTNTVPTHLVSVSPSFEEGGTVSGGGDYVYGSECTVTAEANQGYLLAYWQENGEVVSYEASYTFAVTGDRDLVAFFMPPISVAASTDPEDGGVVNGNGDYYDGATCTLTAVANEGFAFGNWTSNDEVVSYEAAYTFTVTEDPLNLVAHFVDASQTCNVVIQMYDTYGDGWNGNNLVLTLADGTEQYVTLSDGPSGSEIYSIIDGTAVRLSWSMGSYTEECSFDITFENGVPLYHGQDMYSGFNDFFIMNCADETAPRTISAVADPEEAGVVLGAGVFESGQTITLEAVHNDGWIFSYWEEDGVEVSYDPSMTFLVSIDRTLVAHFLKACIVDPENLQVQVNTQDFSEATVSWESHADLFELRYGEKMESNLSEGFEGGIPGEWTTIDADGDGYTWYNGDPVNNATIYGYNSNQCAASASYINNVGVLYPDNYLVTPEVNLGGVFAFWAAELDRNYPFEHFGVAVSTGSQTDPADFTMIQEWTMTSKGEVGPKGGPRGGNRDYGNWYYYEVDLSDYAGQMGYIAIRHFNCSDQYFLLVDDINYASTSVSEWMTITNITETNYTLTGLDDASDYIVQVRATCGDGESYSNWVETGFSTEHYTITASVEPEEGGSVLGAGIYFKGDRVVLEVTLEEGYQFVNWMENGEVISYDTYLEFDATADRELVAHIVRTCTVDPYYIEAYPNGFTEADVYWGGSNDLYDLRYRTANIEGFEKGIPGDWATIDADGDGQTWATVQPDYGFAFVGHNSNQSVSSGSYSNYIGALTPDNYLVTPQLNLGGTFAFWAAELDPYYPEEYFGVAVSTGSQTDPADFTMIQEWTMTAKGVSGPKGGPRGGNRDPSNWYYYEVDLSAYAGQTGYVAIRHFNCTDQYYLLVDDVEYFAPGEPVWTVVTNYSNTYYHLSELEEMKDYLIQVRSSCGDGESYSNWIQTLMTTTHYTVSLTCEPEGVAEMWGDGTYYKDNTCYVGTQPYIVGYRFVNWTRDGEVVSDYMDYSFTVTKDVELVAHYEPYPEVEGQIEYTSYDWQTNRGLYSQPVTWTNGDVTFAYIVSKARDFTDRGTGIGTYHAESGEWSAVGGRVETERSGYGSIARYGDNGMVIVSHTGSDCRVYVVADRDQIESEMLEPVSILENTYIPKWASVMTSGVNRDIIHVLATAEYEVAGMAGVTNAILYFRSTDGGLTWDKENVVLPFLTPEYGIYWNPNCYGWMETTEGNRLSLMVNNAWSDGMVIYSDDDGETWERKVFYQHPGPFDYQDQFYYPRSVSCQWDSNGKLHVLYEFNGTSGYPSDGDYYPSIGGVAYWNEDMEVMDKDYLNNEIKNKSWYHDNTVPMPMEYIGYLPPLTDEGDPENPYENTGFNIYDYQAHGSYNQGICGFPVLCRVPGSDDMVAVWVAMDENHTDIYGRHYFKIFARYSANAGQAWSPMVQLTKDASCENYEHVYLQAAVEGRTLLVAAQVDGETGSFLMNADYEMTNNFYRGFSFDLDETFVTTPMELYTVTVEANPEEGGTVQGSGEFYEGAFISLQAETNPSFGFVNWTFNGEEVSTNPNCVAMVTGSGAFVANFRAYLESLSDDFNDGWVNPDYWVAVGSDVYESNGLMHIEQNITDDNVRLTTRPMVIPESRQIVMNRGFEVQTTGNPFNGGFGICFDGDENNYIRIAYWNEGYIGKYGTYVDAQINGETTEFWMCDAVFDQWIDEKVEIDLTTGTLLYYQGDELIAEVTVNGLSGLEASVFNMYFWPYGWYTGHYQFMDYININADVTEATITVVASNEEGGTVLGGGVYPIGETCTLEAQINDRYEFLGWLKNGLSISDENPYTFTVRSNADYVALIEPIVYHNITVSADLVEGGTVSGGGEYAFGSYCELYAEPAEGYVFVNWTLNGVVVSSDPYYSFYVYDSGEYVAHFVVAVYHTITLSVDPVEAGTASGEGDYLEGTTCTIYAHSEQGYLFSHWTFNGEVVSGSAEYSFPVYESGEYVAHFEEFNGVFVGDWESTADFGNLPSYCLYNNSLTQQIYTAEEIGMSGPINAVSFYCTRNPKEDSRIIDIYLVHTEKTSFGSNQEWIPVTEEDLVFSGEVFFTLDDWNTFYFDHSFVYNGTDNLALIVNDHSGHWESTRYFRTYTTETNQAIYIYRDASPFDPFNPESGGYLTNKKNNILLWSPQESGEIDQTLELSNGWTWMSVYVEASDEVFEAIKDGIAENNTTAMIKDNEGGSLMLQGDYGWQGELDLVNEGMYMTNLGTPVTLNLTAAPADPAAHPITIGTGWNWIGFISSEPMTVEEAMSGITPNNGDMIKGQGPAWAFTSGSWMGEGGLQPGTGYMYYNKGADMTLVYPASSKGVVRSIPMEKYWSTNVHEHATNLVVMATLDESQFAMGEGNYEIGAFVNGECRGSSRLLKTSNGYVALVVVHGEYDETISFKLYDVTNAMVVGSSEEQLRYVSNAIVGSVEEPMVLHFRGVTDVNEDANSLSVFPNPTKDNVKIQGQAIETVCVYNALGQCLLNETFGNATDVELNLSGLSAGVYTVAIRANGTVITKLVVKE